MKWFVSEKQDILISFSHCLYSSLRVSDTETKILSTVHRNKNFPRLFVLKDFPFMLHIKPHMGSTRGFWMQRVRMAEWESSGVESQSE